VPKLAPPDDGLLDGPNALTRESTIVLDAQGQFWHDGERVQHKGVARAFACWLGLHPDDGRFVLDNGYDWCYLTVEDTPYFVRSVHVDSEPVEVELFDGSREPLDPQTLVVGSDEVLRVRVKAGAFEARFSRSAQLQIEPLLDPEPPLAVRLGGLRFPIGTDEAR
jgi:hypothetical protein